MASKNPVQFPFKDSDGTVRQGQVLPIDANDKIPVGVTNTTGAPINPATAEGIETLRTLLVAIGQYLDGVEGNQTVGNTSLADIKALLTAQSGFLDGLETNQSQQTNEIIRIGTRAYGAGQRLGVTVTSAQSAAITATEVLLHATGRIYVLAGANPSVSPTTGIPLESGEKFTMRITSGQKIAAVRDAGDTDGFLQIIPVV